MRHLRTCCWVLLAACQPMENPGAILPPLQPDASAAPAAAPVMSEEQAAFKEEPETWTSEELAKGDVAAVTAVDEPVPEATPAPAAAPIAPAPVAVPVPVPIAPVATVPVSFG